MKHLGIDIGGSGVKGAVVDTKKGVFVTDRIRFDTPQPATPDAVARVVAQIVKHFEWDQHFGCTFPGVVTHGTIRTAANMDKSWVGVDAQEVFKDATGLKAAVMNDADAAGVAEASFGAAKGIDGLVMLVTLGTGIGTAVIIKGELVPNTELGHIELNGRDAEQFAAESVREREGLSWDEWATRLTRYFGAVEALLSPDLFVVGGGVSKQPDPWLPKIRTRTEIIPARLRNKAGIIGAALLSEREHGSPKR